MGGASAPLPFAAHPDGEMKYIDNLKENNEPIRHWSWTQRKTHRNGG